MHKKAIYQQKQPCKQPPFQQVFHKIDTLKKKKTRSDNLNHSKIPKRSFSRKTFLINVKTSHLNQKRTLSSPTMVGVGKEMVGIW